MIARCHPRHRAVEFRKFLATIDAQVPADLDVHLILDNLSTRKAPKVKRWLAQHPRYHLHFTPTSSSWLNQVETWFSLLTRRQLRRGVHRCVSELETALLTYAEHGNETAKPFRWTKSADEILQSVKRFCLHTSNSRHQRRQHSQLRWCHIRTQDAKSPAEEEFVAAMKSDLRNMVTAQEFYFSDFGNVYSPNTSNFGSHCKTSPGVTRSTMAATGGTGWSAQATHTGTSKSCVISVGSASAPEGERICSQPRISRQASQGRQSRGVKRIRHAARVSKRLVADLFLRG